METIVRRIPDYTMIIDSIAVVYGITKKSYPYVCNDDKTYDCPECNCNIPKNHGIRHYRVGRCNSMRKLVKQGYISIYNDNKLCISKAVADMIGGICKVRLKKIVHPTMDILKRLCAASFSGFKIRAIPIILHEVEFMDNEFKPLNEIIDMAELHIEIQNRIKATRYTHVPCRGGELKRKRPSNNSIGNKKYIKLIEDTGVSIPETKIVGLLTD